MALYRIMHENEFDMAAVTVTRVSTSRNLRNAHVHVSIRERDKQQQMLSLLKKHRGELQKLVSQNVVLKYTPHLLFELDTSLEEGDRVLDVLRELGQTDEDKTSDEDVSEQ